MSTLLEIHDLGIDIESRGRPLRVVDGVSLTVGAGEVVGLVGESGSGKTLTALSVVGLLPRGVRVVEGSSIRFQGREVLDFSANELRALRGASIGSVFQNPFSAFNPVLTVGSQIEEVAHAHLGLRGQEARRAAVALLQEMGVPEANARAGEYPHRFSGGMLQRAGIAMALAGEPSLLLADEPTTAVDAGARAKILDLLKRQGKERGLGVLLISHDLAHVAGSCDRLYVMYAGQIVESGPATEVLQDPGHPYTRGLLASSLYALGRRSGVRPIMGTPPSSEEWPSGCRFHPRCAHKMDRCESEDPVPALGGGGAVCCWLHGAGVGGEV